MAWSDIYKLFKMAYEPDPTERRTQRNLKNRGAGVTGPDVIPNLMSSGEDGSLWGGSKTPLRIQIGDSVDFIDLSSVTNRFSRYKEYDRLQNVAEVETALNTYADEACVVGETQIMTPFGPISIEELAKTKKSDEQFLVYCWDFNKEDYSLGWAYHPRYVKTAPTVKVVLDNGEILICTPDHKILTSDKKWVEAGSLKEGNYLMPFHRVKPNHLLTNLKTNQFRRIYSFNRGWIHERQFLEEWKKGESIPKYEKTNKVTRLIQAGLTIKKLMEATGWDWKSIVLYLHREGFTKKEIEYLTQKYPTKRRVLGVFEHKELPVYDISVKDHQNFASDNLILHNCQEDDDGQVFQVRVKNQEVKKEAEILLKKVLSFDDRCWGIMKNLCKYGDYFLEIIIDPIDPKKFGVIGIQPLPPDSMYRIESVKGMLVEFQQSKEGPDYQSLARVDVMKASQAELAQSTAIRFTPEQIVHLRLGDDRKEFYPYGVSTIESARGPAHNLRLSEDAALTYRITRCTERRVFYVDVGTLPPFKAEAYIERMKDQFRKKKVFTKKGAGAGASAVEERYHVPAIDEDYWIPMRPNSNTRIDTLPGASNLDEIGDVNYWRNKLLISLNFPRNYLSNDDPQASRLTLSQQDVRFARFIERLQKPLQSAIQEIAYRHFRIKGYPDELYEDLEIEITPPSDWRKINRNEVDQAKYDRSATLKGSQLMSDYDIYVEIMEYPEDKAKAIVSRMKAQKLEELKMQIIGQNPELLGINTPEKEGTEIGATPGGPNPSIGQDMEQPPQGGEGGDINQKQNSDLEQGTPEMEAGKAMKLPEPSEDDINKYDLKIIDYAQDMEREEVDSNDTE